MEILGLTCTLCDNCRCLDCQVGQHNDVTAVVQIHINVLSMVAINFHALYDSILLFACSRGQSRYFECDDSDFFMDDCYEYIEQDDDMEECSFYKYPIQQGSGTFSATSSIPTTIVHPETCPQENLLHSNCMEMCDKEIQYDESLFGDNAAAAAVVTELNGAGGERDLY